MPRLASRRRVLLLAGLLGLLMPFGTATAPAQQEAPNGRQRHATQTSDTTGPVDRTAHAAPPRMAFGAWLGASFTARTVAPDRRIDRDVLILGLRASRPIAGGPIARLSYVFDLLPVILVAGPHRPAPPGVARDSGVARIGMADSRRPTAYGFGVTPLGVELELGPQRGLGAVIGISVGGAIFTRPIPTTRATQANFIAAPGAAVQFRATRTMRFILGYKLYHFSNASMGDTNPGLNAHLVYLSVVQPR